MQDLTINLDAEGNPELDLQSGDMSTTIKNPVIFSILTPRGGFFQNPEFGSRHHQVEKITGNSLQLIRAYILESLQWLIDTGKAISNDVTVIQDGAHRVRIDTATVQADGLEVTFSTWYEVG